jgi:hypothetical protein
VNYRPDGPIQNVAVEIRIPADRSVRAVTLASPEREQDLRLEAKSLAGRVSFSVASVPLYEIAIIELE